MISYELVVYNGQIGGPVIYRITSQSAPVAPVLGQDFSIDNGPIRQVLDVNQQIVRTSPTTCIQRVHIAI